MWPNPKSSQMIMLISCPVTSSSANRLPICPLTPASSMQRNLPRRPGRRSIPSPEPAEASNWNWLIWVAAGGLTLFGGILLIGPRLREGFGSKPVGGPESELRPISEHAAPRTPSISAARTDDGGRGDLVLIAPTSTSTCPTTHRPKRTWRSMPISSPARGSRSPTMFRSTRTLDSRQRLISISS